MSALRDNTSSGLEHPEWQDGRRLWVAPEVKQVIEWLHYGYPPLGWEGDPALALYIGDKNEWVIQRWENGRYNLVCRSKPGVSLDLRLIAGLVEMDTRRKTAQAILDAVNDHNDKLQASVSAAAHEKQVDALERVYWHVGKSV